MRDTKRSRSTVAWSKRLRKRCVARGLYTRPVPIIIKVIKTMPRIEKQVKTKSLLQPHAGRKCTRLRVFQKANEVYCILCTACACERKVRCTNHHVRCSPNVHLCTSWYALFVAAPHIRKKKLCLTSCRFQFWASGAQS